MELTKSMEVTQVTDYKVKGTSIKNLKKYLDSLMGPGSFDNLNAKVGLVSGNLILSSSWYDAEKTLRLNKLAAERMEQTFKEFTLHFTDYMMQADLNGVFKFLLRLGGINRILASSPRIAQAYSNFLEFRIVRNEKGCFQVRLVAPASLIEWEIYSTEGSVRGLFNVFELQVIKLNVADKLSLDNNYQSVLMEFNYG